MVRREVNMQGRAAAGLAAGLILAIVAIAGVVLSSSTSRSELMLQPHTRAGEQLVMLNPGLRSGELKLPDDPWGYQTPRCRGLPTCSSSTSSPAVQRRQGALRMAHGQHRQDRMQEQPRRMQSMKQVVRGEKKGLSMTEQYAKIMQNEGYFAPWSRQNGWVDRVAIDNIRKANTPQALAQRQQMIETEDKKFAKKFSTPHTSQYTGVHQSLADILDPKFQPWANDAPRKAYYAGF